MLATSNFLVPGGGLGIFLPLLFVTTLVGLGFILGRLWHHRKGH